MPPQSIYPETALTPPASTSFGLATAPPPPGLPIRISRKSARCGPTCVKPCAASLSAFFSSASATSRSIPASAKHHSNPAKSGKVLAPARLSFSANCAPARALKRLSKARPFQQARGAMPCRYSVYHGASPLFRCRTSLSVALPQRQKPLFHVEQRAIEQPATPLWRARHHSQPSVSSRTKGKCCANALTARTYFRHPPFALHRAVTVLLYPHGNK